MKLDTRCLSEGEPLVFRHSLDLSGLLFSGQRVFSVPIDIEGSLEGRANGLILKGTYRTVLSLVCDRCALLFSREHSGCLEAVLQDDPPQQDREDIVLLQNGVCDLDEIFTPAIILSLDTKNLCKPDCRGICVSCGQDLNRQSCICGPRPTDPRLEALRRLLQDGGDA
ncbi:MAG: DUF177 domain-containing protein [Oscillospiraceae bacterium]|nr:DUF177 domain-containing protein [Oscillospiraceae bacterium]